MAETQIVHLNIGGIRYDTTFDTLAVVKGPMMTSYLKTWEENKQGEIFIDRDGRNFVYILNILRDGSKAVLPKDEVVFEELKREMEFYGVSQKTIKKAHIVHLNIGGVHYDTSYETLISAPGQKFAKYRDKWTEHKEQDIFIDRDGTNFKYILNFLRLKEKMSLPNDPAVLEEIKEDAMFYELPALVKLLDVKIKAEYFEQMISSPRYVHVKYHEGDTFDFDPKGLASECHCDTAEKKMDQKVYLKALKSAPNGLKKSRVIREYLTCFDVQFIDKAMFHVHKNVTRNFGVVINEVCSKKKKK